MNTYVCFHRGKQYHIEAPTSYDAQKKCAAENRIKKAYEITVMLVAIGGKPYEHSTAGL